MHSAAPVYFENVNAHLFEIANEMHFLISQMHKIKHEDLELFKHFEARFDELSKKLEQIREKVGDKADALVQSLSNLKTGMNDYAELLRSTKIEKIKNFSNRFEEESSKFKKEFSTKIAEKQLKYKELNEKIGIQYEEFLLNFKSSSLNPKQEILIKLKHLKPKNYKRNLFHAFNSLMSLCIYQYLLDKTGVIYLMITLSTILVGVESGRRFIPKFNDWLMEKVFHKVSRPHERFQINSATYYVWGLFLMVMLFPKEACLLGVLTLGFGDPIASIVGQRYGKIKIFKEKSLEGALAFWLAGFAICLIYQLIYIPQIPLLDIIKISSIVAFVGALTELFTIKIDDNFSIPVISALVASFLLVGYGIY